MTALLTFAGFAALLTILPGPDSLLVLRTAISQGRRAALIAALGIGAGCLWWGAAAGLGLTAVLAASHTLYTVLRWAGAVLPGLPGRTAPADPSCGGRGARAVRPEPVRPGSVDQRAQSQGGCVLPVAATAVRAPRTRRCCRGACCWPAYTSRRASPGALLAVLADRVGNRLRRPAVRRALDRVAGTAFLGFALRLALRP